MILNKEDEEFLLWLYNRLNLKHREDKHILDRLISIIDKYKIALSITSKDNIFLDNAVKKTAEYLSAVYKQHHKQISGISSKLVEYQVEKTVPDFENLDLDQLLK